MHLYFCLFEDVTDCSDLILESKVWLQLNSSYLLLYNMKTATNSSLIIEI